MPVKMMVLTKGDGSGEVIGESWHGSEVDNLSEAMAQQKRAPEQVEMAMAAVKVVAHGQCQ